MAKRFEDNPADASPDGSDIMPGTDVSLGEDRKYTFNTIGVFVKTFIGNATTSLNGLMSSSDKTKLDGYAVHNPGNDLYLTTNGLGAQVWEAKPSAVGDMTKAVYDSDNNGKVDSAEEADAISGTPGNDQVYTTDAGGIQTWIPKSSLGDMLKSVYDTGNVGKVDVSLDTEKVLTRTAVNWNGQTTGASITEIFTDGVSSQLTLASDKAYAVTIEVMALKDDISAGGYFIRQAIIKNSSGTTALVGSVQTVGTDINPSTLGGVTITADDANDALKLEVTGKAAETWNWKAATIVTEI